VARQRGDQRAPGRSRAPKRGVRSRRSPARAVPIDRIIRRLMETSAEWKATAVTMVAEEKRTPFRVLIACLLSLRTQDATTGPAAARLFALADTPEAMLGLTPATIERAIYPVGFYRTKARAILDICRDLIARFGGRVPDEIDDLTTLRGVGRKTANLVVTIGFGKPGICVDTHVHRISNRFGYVRTKTPTETEVALRATLPHRYWIGYNDLLVTFGQNVCTPLSPKCSICPVRSLCRRVGVTRAR
jgi:endonuclease III